MSKAGIAGIANWMKQKGIEPDTYDIVGEYDHGISYSENLKHFKTLVKTGGKKKSKKQHDAAWCEYVEDECIKGHKDACASACKDCKTHCKPKKSTKKKTKSMKKKSPITDRRRAKRKKVCKKVNVKKHTRKCPSRKYLR